MFLLLWRLVQCGRQPTCMTPLATPHAALLGQERDVLQLESQREPAHTDWSSKLPFPLGLVTYRKCSSLLRAEPALSKEPAQCYL
jgi:hypothetical protein